MAHEQEEQIQMKPFLKRKHSWHHYLLSIYFFCVKLLMRLITIPNTSELRSLVKRPVWLYYPGVEMDPIKFFTFSPSDNSSSEDIQLCERLIAAYKTAVNDASPTETTSEIWDKMIQTRYGTLAKALHEGDPKALSDVLSNMFQKEFLVGISSATLGLYSSYAPFVRMKLTEEILSLAEALAVVRTETPEQGMLGYGLKEGLPSLIDGIEGSLKISVDFPRVSGAYGLLINGRLVTPEAPEHIYVAKRIKDALGQYVIAKDDLKIVEIGAGFGGLCFWLNRLLPLSIASYTIIDLPYINACQGYFLAKVFGAEKVCLYGEKGSNTTRFTIIPPQATTEAFKDDFHLLINENSMPEIPEDAVKNYLSLAKIKLTGIFFSYNQEAFSPNHLSKYKSLSNVIQTFVPGAVLGVGGYTRLSRCLSWVRRGYVEEIYSPNKHI